MSRSQGKIESGLSRISKKAFKYLLFLNLIIMIVVFSSLVVNVMAQGTATASQGGKFIGAGISIAGSTIGAGIALSGTASSGLAAVVEKPGMATWLLLIAGLSEGIAIYGLIISIIILGA